MRPPLALALLLAAGTLFAAEPAATWPEFRGPTAQGISAATNLPLTWSPTENVAWKVVVPGSGWSSPVVGDGKIYFTTGVVAEGVGTSLRALCLDGATGRTLWDTEVFKPTEVPEQHPLHSKNSPASPTPILAGDRLYVHFGHHGIAALDLTGNIRWRNNRFRYDAVHGNGGSPVFVEGRLIFAADGAKDPAVMAIYAATGDIAWKTPRPIEVRQPFSFCTPLVIEVGGQRQVIIPGAGIVSALNPRDGRELWHATYKNGYSVVPRPGFAHGLVFISTGYNRADLLAIKADGAGDVTDTHIAWRTSKGAPLTPSFLVVGDELYAVNDGGIATCWDARTGEVHWQQRIDGNFSASPLAAGDR
ncbi:MAG TPA: PQQ-binding-like beta-propeller repeat protein, partial [Opitutaceae bacterium]